MSIIYKLASSLNRRDEIPNQELAKQIANSNDRDAVKELFDNLRSNNKDIQNDCIKVVYEIGALNPELIAGYAKELVTLLEHKNNRLQWGAMTALNAITKEDPKTIFSALPKIITAANKGSVITNDQCVAILIKLSTAKDYAKDAFPPLIQRLKISPTNQLPMYAENSLPIITDKNKAQFIHVLRSRLSEIEKESGKLRVEKVIRKASNRI